MTAEATGFGDRTAAARPADPLHVVFLCTGNAARSAMAAIIARTLTDALEVTGAGTHVIPGLPMSHRTRNALAALGFADPSHRSTQLEQWHVDAADLIVAFAPEHVAYVRRVHPGGASRTATLRRLVRDLDRVDAGARTGRAGLATRLTELALDTVSVEPWEEVLDPAGGDEEVFVRCAAEVHELVLALLSALGLPSVGGGSGVRHGREPGVC